MRSINYRAPYKAAMERLIPDPEGRAEVEIAIKWLVDKDPKAGKNTGIGLPVPQFAITIKKSIWNPALVVYYVFTDKYIVFINVIATDVGDTEL